MALDSFTTLALVRDAAGFTGNTDVTDATITLDVDAANAQLISALQSRYVLPLNEDSYYSGSPAEDWLSKLATNLAVANLYLREFVGTSDSLDYRMTDLFRISNKEVAKLQSGEMNLVGSDSNILPVKDSGLKAANGYPDNTADAPEFSMSDTF